MRGGLQEENQEKWLVSRGTYEHLVPQFHLIGFLIHKIPQDVSKEEIFPWVIRSINCTKSLLQMAFETLDYTSSFSSSVKQLKHIDIRFPNCAAGEKPSQVHASCQDQIWGDQRSNQKTGRRGKKSHRAQFYRNILRGKIWEVVHAFTHRYECQL